MSIRIQPGTPAAATAWAKVVELVNHGTDYCAAVGVNVFTADETYYTVIHHGKEYFRGRGWSAEDAITEAVAQLDAYLEGRRNP